MTTEKRIHFDHLGNRNLWILILIFSIILFLIGIFKPFEFLSLKNSSYMFSFGVLLQIIYLSRIFWYKNTVQWNKKGLVIRIESFLGKSLRFDQIKATELNEKVLIITKTKGEKVKIDLNEIEESDALKLYKIILKNRITLY